MTLKDLPIGKTATIRTVGGEGALRQHFLDMGIICLLYTSPSPRDCS